MKTSELGITRILAVIIAVVVASVAASAAYYVYTTTAAPTTTSTTPTTTSTTPTTTSTTPTTTTTAQTTTAAKNTTGWSLVWPTAKTTTAQTTTTAKTTTALTTAMTTTATPTTTTTTAPSATQATTPIANLRTGAYAEYLVEGYSGGTVTTMKLVMKVEGEEVYDGIACWRLSVTSTMTIYSSSVKSVNTWWMSKDQLEPVYGFVQTYQDGSLIFEQELDPTQAPAPVDITQTVGLETITAAAGTFANCNKVESRSGTQVTDVWVHPSVPVWGVVRIQAYDSGNLAMTMELSAYTAYTGAQTTSSSGGAYSISNFKSDKASYAAGEKVTITGTLLSGTTAVANTYVNVEVRSPAKTVWLDSVKTDSSGVFTSSFTLASDAESGTYTIYATYGNLKLTTTFTKL